MCGLFGFITRDGSGPNLARLRRIAVETQQRGRHAFGLAWLDSAGEIKVFKRPGAASEQLEDLERCRNARIVIGHCRYATHGDPQDNRNNHPHPAGNGFIAHNGVIRNFKQLIANQKLTPRTECDSEILGLLIAKNAGSLVARASRAVEMADGPLAMLGLWRGPNRLVIIRRGNPLHFGMTGDGFYFGSLSGELPGNVFRATDENISVLTLGKDQLQLQSRKIGAH